MDFDKLNKWLGLIANFGVLIGIFILIAELNQASRQADASAYQTMQSEVEESARDIALSNELAELMVRYENEGLEGLDPVEVFRLQSWERARMRRMQSQFYQYQQGFLEELTINRTFLNIVNYSYPRWLELDFLNGIDNQEFAAEIEARVGN